VKNYINPTNILGNGFYWAYLMRRTGPQDDEIRHSVRKLCSNVVFCRKPAAVFGFCCMSWEQCCT